MLLPRAPTRAGVQPPGYALLFEPEQLGCGDLITDQARPCSARSSKGTSRPRVGEGGDDCEACGLSQCLQFGDSRGSCASK